MLAALGGCGLALESGGELPGRFCACLPARTGSAGQFYITTGYRMVYPTRGFRSAQGVPLCRRPGRGTANRHHTTDPSRGDYAWQYLFSARCTGRFLCTWRKTATTSSVPSPRRFRPVTTRLLHAGPSPPACSRRAPTTLMPVRRMVGFPAPRFCGSAGKTATPVRSAQGIL